MAMFTPEKLAEIRKLAESGDANAQYALAASLSQSGSRDESRKWLEKSAAQDHGDALYTLATLQFGSFDAMPGAIELLERAAARGNPLARRQLAAILIAGAGVESDAERANQFLLGAARSDDHAAMTEIAAALTLQNPDDPDVSPLLREAASRDGTAAAVFVSRAALGRPNTDTHTAKTFLSKLSAARYPHAAFLEDGLREAHHQTVSDATLEWDAISTRLLDESTINTKAEALSERPHIKIYRKVVPPELCEYVIAHTARLLAPAKIVDPVTGQSRPDSIRHSYTATIGLVDVDTIIARINRCVAEIVGRPADHGEFLSILHYQPGQEYKRHYDWLPDGDDVARNGQRAATALLCLNDDYEGGETHFVTPDLNVRGSTGDLIVFENVTSDGAIDRETQHAGLPVKNGAKWMASRWFRERIYRF
ncbi:MAG: hypothetical protein HKN14_01935 [Marinicaulis sp.]|nr:hypothetical protein [Marinicaulis sp.]